MLPPTAILKGEWRSSAVPRRQSWADAEQTERIDWEFNGKFPAMKVTMDGVGRIVIPKGLRDQLGLRPDEELDASIDGNAIRLEPRSAGPRVVVKRKGLAVLRSVEGAVLSDRMVRDLRDADQR